MQVKIPSKEEETNHQFKDPILTLLGFILKRIYSKKGGAVNEINDYYEYNTVCDHTGLN